MAHVSCPVLPLPAPPSHPIPAYPPTCPQPSPACPHPPPLQAYRLLARGGLHPDNIITFMFDDIARNVENPHPGKLFNRPGGEDVYDGVVVDYSGFNVNARQFLAVLAGDAVGAGVAC